MKMSLSQKTQLMLGASLVAVLAIVMMGVQHLTNFVKKGIAEGQNMRIQEANACQPGAVTKGDAPHFSGCNSIL